MPLTELTKHLMTVNDLTTAVDFSVSICFDQVDCICMHDVYCGAVYTLETIYAYLHHLLHLCGATTARPMKHTGRQGRNDCMSKSYIASKCIPPRAIHTPAAQRGEGPAWD